jgi:hypothetical protein
LLFVDILPAHLDDGEVAIDLRRDSPADAPSRSELTRILRAHAEQWRAAFVDWMGSLNRQNASLAWWAHTSTAKNFLSSPLGNHCFEALALERFLSSTNAARVFVSGADSAQQAAFQERLAGRWRVKMSLRWSTGIETLARLAWQFLRILGLWCLGRLRPPAGRAPDAVVFTYVDGAFRDGPDAFFGSLAQHLANRTPAISVCHVAFVHSGYLAALPKLAKAKHRYAALFSFVRFPDLLWSLNASFRAWRRAGSGVASPDLDGMPGASLLKGALLWDLGKGGYFYNVLVYRAARRMLRRWKPRWLLYPYENKSLEKSLLLAARESCPGCRVVGFQHTSITRRHATLLFAEGEAEITPLPDRIVTVGEVTRRFLETHGRYPPGMFATGCALRQQSGTLLERRAPDGIPRVVLALSSSRQELSSAVEMCRQAMQGGARFELGIRPHPEFPLALLHGSLRDWVGNGAIDLTGTALHANLEWCDCVAYVSSTVALEALGRGRPVIHLSLAEPLNPDPILDPVAFHWTAETPAALAATLAAVAALGSVEFKQRRRDGLDYVKRYLGPQTPEALALFTPA